MRTAGKEWRSCGRSCAAFKPPSETVGSSWPTAACNSGGTFAQPSTFFLYLPECSLILNQCVFSTQSLIGSRPPQRDQSPGHPRDRSLAAPGDRSPGHLKDRLAGHPRGTGLWAAPGGPVSWPPLKGALFDDSKSAADSIRLDAVCRVVLRYAIQDIYKALYPDDRPTEKLTRVLRR